MSTRLVIIEPNLHAPDVDCVSVGNITVASLRVITMEGSALFATYDKTDKLKIEKPLQKSPPLSTSQLRLGAEGATGPLSGFLATATG